MIKKGLKVGDTFTDGNFLYKINSVDSKGGYISSLVGKAGGEDKTPKVEATKEVKETENLEDMSFVDLKKLAKAKGVSSKGSKEEVIERLRGI